MPRKRRVRGYITLRLSADKDADLIAWWENVPDGQGAELVKQAIRQMLTGENQSSPATATDVERAARWVVEQVRGMALSGGHADPPLQDGGERLSDEEIRKIERTVRARRW